VRPVAGVAGTFTLVALDGALVAMLLLAAVRDRARGVLLASLGAALYAAGNAHEATGLLSGRAPGWPEAALGGSAGWRCAPAS
jgi:hypothetical protein